MHFHPFSFYLLIQFMYLANIGEYYVSLKQLIFIDNYSSSHVQIGILNSSRGQIKDYRNGQNALNHEPALELHSRAAPSVEAHHRINGPDTERNSGGRWIKKILWHYSQGYADFFSQSNLLPPYLVRLPGDNRWLRLKVCEWKKRWRGGVNEKRLKVAFMRGIGS